MARANTPRLWAATAVIVAAITIGYGTAILRTHEATRASVERLVLHGPGGQSDSIMHQVSLKRRDGRTAKVGVSGSATRTQLIDVIEAFNAGDADPEGWKVTSWTIEGGTTIKVSTPPEPGESKESLCARHDAFVADLQERFPPV